jgi:putative ABC transport system permease protein
MFRNYLKVALRNLWKSKGYTAINIIGLAAGLGVCLLIVLYVTDEISYDRYNANAGRIYRIDADVNFNNTQIDAVATPQLMGPTLVRTYPRIQQMVRFRNPGDILVKKGNDRINDHHAVFADSTLFQVFTIPLIQGNPNTALNTSHSIVIDESAALRYFNSTDVVGKTLEIGSDNTLVKVTGVFRDMPENSQFHFSFIRPLRDGDMGDPTWLSNNYPLYILAQPGVSREALQKDVDQCVSINLGRELQSMLHTNEAELEKAGNHFRYHLMPLTDIHLHSNKQGELEANGDIQTVYIFSIIAALILLIACVNFMNLSTARSANRAREVGIRKVAGSTRGYLIAQFLTESVLLCLFSLVIALGIALLLLPYFNQLAGKDLRAPALFGPRFLLILLAPALLVGVLAGSYPAFYLSSFQPIQVLKGKVAAGFKSSWLRSSLVVGQFVISIGLIVCTLVVYRQLQYIRSREIGFNRDQVLVLHNTSDFGGKNVVTLRKDLIRMSGVTDVAVSSDMPTKTDGYDQDGWFRTASLDARQIVVVTNLFVDDRYVPTLGMKMAKGRNFDITQFKTDSSALIINEAAAALLGFKDPVNQTLYHPGDSMKPVPYHIVGVVKDFNYSSMHDRIYPLVMQFADNFGAMAIRFRTADVFGLVGQIEAKWHGIQQGIPFNYTFLNDDFNKMYAAEQKTSRLFITFAVFAIFIACLGLFGLVTYAAEQRMKEIGIRKVLGANLTGIVGLLCKDFVLLIGIGALIAFPLAGWFMYKWLQSFAYRTDIGWWIFLVAGLTALAIALFTVSIQTIRAAVTNPIKSLRTE